MALHHKLCHTLGGSFNLPHAEVHSVVLPHVIAFNQSAILDALPRMARALDAPTQNPASALYELARVHGAPVSLRDIGMKEGDLDRAAELAVQNPYWNPRAIGPDQRDDLRRLLQAASEGRRPA